MRLLSDKKGSVTVQATGAIIAVMFLFGIVYSYAKMTAISSGIRNNVRNAVIQTVASNYYTAYDGLREGNTGAYYLDSSDNWQDDLTKGDISSNLASFLRLKNSGSELQKVSSTGSMLYSISNLSVTAQNDDLASNDKRLTIRTTYTLNIPVSFFIVKTQPISLPMSASAEIEEKY